LSRVLALLALPPAALVLAAGGWSLAVALAPLPPAASEAPAVAPRAVPPDPPATAPAAPWPALFGTPPAPVAFAPATVAPAAPRPPPPPPEARLRGLAVDEGGGWALIETAAGVAFLRPGGALDAENRVVAIDAAGVTLDGPGGPWELGFVDTPATAPVRDRPRPGLAQALLGGTRYFYDGGGLPMPLPPEGYQTGPGPIAGDRQ
jgi:hypothetical protein